MRYTSMRHQPNVTFTQIGYLLMHFVRAEQLLSCFKRLYWSLTVLLFYLSNKLKKYTDIIPNRNITMTIPTNRVSLTLIVVLFVLFIFEKVFIEILQYQQQLTMSFRNFRRIKLFKLIIVKCFNFIL